MVESFSQNAKNIIVSHYCNEELSTETWLILNVSQEPV